MQLRWPVLCLTCALQVACARETGSSAAPTSTVAPAKPAAATAGTRVAEIAADESELRTESFSPYRYISSAVRNGGVIFVFHSICTGSADGHCQAIQVFRAGGSKPVWKKQYAGVLALRPSVNGFTVTSVHYAPSDPLCCPSLPPVTERYRWNGSTFASTAHTSP